MPHGDEQGSTDEVKVFKHEEDDEENLGAEDLDVEDRLTEDKSSLITESETKATDGAPSDRESEAGSAFGPLGRPYEPLPERHPFGYLYNPYSPYNGTLSMAGKMGLASPTLSPFFYNSDPLSQPPPAHMGIPPYQLDPKPGMPRAPVYPFTPVSSHCPYPIGATDLPGWHSPALYPSTSGAFRSPYSGLPHSLHRFSPGLLPPSLPPHLVHPDQLKQNGDHRNGVDVKPVISAPQSAGSAKTSQSTSQEAERKKPHIKKPLNAFMLYMKEMRAKVVAECTLKESAAINQILGRRWHALNREEQSKYYEMARKERQLHMQMYPGWSARDNYAQSKKKKRKRDKVDGAQMKKCRARYGLEQQDQWCKPCRRKKKCIRYMEGGGGEGDDDGDDDDDDDGMDSSGNGNDAATPGSNSGEEESTDDQTNTNSPSVSLASPSLPSLASPGYSVASLLSPSPLASSPLTPAAECASAHQQYAGPPPGGSTQFQQPRTPVGANPRDANNPLSVGQLTNSSPRPQGGASGQRTNQCNSPRPPPPPASCVSVT